MSKVMAGILVLFPLNNDALLVDDFLPPAQYLNRGSHIHR